MGGVFFERNDEVWAILLETRMSYSENFVFQLCLCEVGYRHQVWMTTL